MFWVQEEITQIIKERPAPFLVTDYKTPSGKVHVGALRGVLVHEAIYRALLAAGQKATYLYGFDDFDPMDGLPSYLDKEKWQQYMGLPLCNIPSPQPGFKSYADYYAQDFLTVIGKLGVKPQIVWDSEGYKNGDYNDSIKIALDNSEAIRKIYKDVSGSDKPQGWYPLNVVCPQCGKIGTTQVTDWDGQEVTFSCLPDYVDWAKGCGYAGKISPFNGNSKLPYKLAIVARWLFRQTDVELAGMDHYTKGGSFYVARAIAEQVFKIAPAYGHAYEWFMIGGSKMSSSKGVGASAQEVSDLLPPTLTRFLMLRPPARRRVDFDLAGEAVPRLYDEFDRCVDAYLQDPSSDLAQAYSIARLDDKESLVYRLRFSKIAYLLQMPRADIWQYAENEKGSELTTSERAQIEERLEYAKKWLKSYAPDNYLFTVQEKLPQLDLTDQQKNILRLIHEELFKHETLNGEVVHHALHQIKKDHNIEPSDLFSPLYKIFLAKDSGPQAGWLLASLDRNFVLQRLKEASA